MTRVPNPERRVVFISGASSGIGNACAAFLAKRGCAVYGTSRDPDRVERRADEFFSLIRMDLEDDGSVAEAVRLVGEKEGRIDFLLCNAGLGVAGPALETPLDQARRQLEVNVIGALKLMQAALPYLRRSERPRIALMGSIAGRIGLPFQGLYSASKFALEGLAEALRMELSVEGIELSIIEPGDFRSGFTAARARFGADEGSPYAEAARAALLKAEADERGGAHPIEIAKLVYGLILSRRLRPRYTVGNAAQRFAALIRRAVPDRWFERLIMANYGVVPGARRRGRG